MWIMPVGCFFFAGLSMKIGCLGLIILAIAARTRAADIAPSIQRGAPSPLNEHAPSSQGAVPGSDHWAFQSVHCPVVPRVQNKGRVQTPIDAFILAALEAKKLTMAPPADRPTLIRRAFYDLIGLPPTPQEIESFTGDHSANAFAKVVDRLLASPLMASAGAGIGSTWSVMRTPAI